MPCRAARDCAENSTGSSRARNDPAAWRQLGLVYSWACWFHSSCWQRVTVLNPTGNKSRWECSSATTTFHVAVTICVLVAIEFIWCLRSSKSTWRPGHGRCRRPGLPARFAGAFFNGNHRQRCWPLVHRPTPFLSIAHWVRISRNQPPLSLMFHFCRSRAGFAVLVLKLFNRVV